MLAAGTKVLAASWRYLAFVAFPVHWQLALASLTSLPQTEHAKHHF